jgi:hypothetical protein
MRGHLLGYIESCSVLAQKTRSKLIYWFTRKTAQKKRARIVNEELDYCESFISLSLHSSLNAHLHFEDVQHHQICGISDVSCS